MVDMTTQQAPTLSIQVGRYLPRLIFLGLAVHLLLPQLTSIENSYQIIMTMALWALGLAFAAQVLSYLGSGYMLQGITAAANYRISILYGVVVTLAANSIGLVAGGMVGNAAATYRWLRKRGASPQGAGLAGTLPIIFNNIILLMVTVLGLFHLLLVDQLSARQSASFILIILILGFIIGAAIWGTNHRDHMTSLAVRLSCKVARKRNRHCAAASTEDSMKRLFSAWDALRSGGWHGPALGAAMNIGFDLMTLYFLFMAAGHAVSPGVLLAGYGLPLLFGKIAFLLPGGVGVVEGTMAALYNGLGVPNPITVVVILAYRLLSFWLPTLLGFPIASYLQRSNRKN